MCVDFYALFRIVIDQLPAFNVLSRKIYVMFNTPFTFSYSLHMKISFLILMKEEEQNFKRTKI